MGQRRGSVPVGCITCRATVHMHILYRYIIGGGEAVGRNRRIHSNICFAILRLHNAFIRINLHHTIRSNFRSGVRAIGEVQAVFQSHALHVGTAAISRIFQVVYINFISIISINVSRSNLINICNISSRRNCSTGFLQLTHVHRVRVCCAGCYVFYLPVACTDPFRSELGNIPGCRNYAQAFLVYNGRTFCRFANRQVAVFF